MAQLRLDKYLADAGIGTRSQIKNYIKKGMVTHNDVIVTKPDIKINTEQDTICFQKTPVAISDYEYYLLNKPAGYVSATRDNTAPTVLDLLANPRKGVAPVGRLDKDTEGLLLLTNDGALSHKLLSPKYHIDKVYYAIVDGIMTPEDILAFQMGLEIGDDDLFTALPSILEIKHINIEEKQSIVHITIQEGKFHQVKRMVHAVGKEVTYLKRISFAGIHLPKDLKPGAYRTLTSEEVSYLKNLGTGKGATRTLTI